MDVRKEFGLRVRKMRSTRKMSQEVLAREAGLHRTYVGGIERGERNVSLVNIQKIARALRVGMEDLISGL